MRTLEISILVLGAWTVLACQQTLLAADSSGLIDRLRKTQAVNLESIIDGQFPQSDDANGFRVADPYSSEAAEVVNRWSSAEGRESEFCAIRFVDSDRFRYELRAFESSEAATEANFVVTHQGRCGSCSSLSDLAVYLQTPDLTTPARQCARRFGLKGKKRCFKERIGFTPWCAESWAHNADHTRQACLGTCVADYGLFNLLFNRYPGPNTDETGQLRPCLQCDEDKSGAGFKYSAGRTRRNSGIESAIPRPDSEIYRVDHSAYFQ